MHGRVKSVEREKEEARSDAERRDRLSKVRMYHEVAEKVLSLRAARVRDASVLPLTSHLLLLNPEFHVVWAFRRDVLSELLQADGHGDVAPSELAKTELKLTFEALQRNPKSYAAWFQRQWIVDKGLADLHKEIALCDKLLELDERNFHCWNYRRHVCRLAGVSKDEELAFSALKIDQNFSNYSALHHRSLTLPRPLVPETLLDEISIVQQAVFTEPDDQSAWFYYRWLLTSMLQVVAKEYALEFLESQVHWMNELLEMEEQAKWVLVTLADVHRRRATFEEVAQDAKKQSIAYYEQLRDLDPDHGNYYRDMIRKLTA